MINTQRLVDTFLSYVKCGSESLHEKDFAELLEKELFSLGFEVSRDKTAAEKCGSDAFNIYGYLPGVGEPLLFCSHMDTVAPGTDIKPIIENGIIRSSGDTVLGSDDKSGIAAVTEAVRAVNEAGLEHRPIEVLFTVCEEIGLLGSKYADYSQVKSHEAIVLDSSKTGCVINRSPAMLELAVRITGKASHAAIAPDKGIHALKCAADIISAIPVGYVDDISVMNLANLTALGKTNVVSDTANFEMEIRSFEEDRLQEHLSFVKRTIAETCNKYGAEYELDVDRHSDVLYVPENSGVLKQLENCHKKLGIDFNVDSTYGGCDATNLSANGIGAVNIGTGMSNVHSVSEYIDIADMEKTAAICFEMMLADN